MAAKTKPPLKKVPARDVVIFKIANRRGYAALARNHLTEGRSTAQAYARLIKACRRSGLALDETRIPKPRS